MKVYVVTEWLAYEGEEVLDVFETLEAARREHPGAEFMQERCVTCGGIFDDCDCEGTDEEVRKHIKRTRRRGHGKNIDEHELKA